MNQSVVYKSGEIHNSQQAEQYAKTHESPHRFLAYRDFHSLINKFPKIHRVLDLGCGTGASSHFLYQVGFEVVGIDKSTAMVEGARSNFNHIRFEYIQNIDKLTSFDLVFSSFVLFELETKQEIISYLNQAASLLRNEGIFFGITGSENLHQIVRSWLCFNVNYEENSNPKSGDIVKLGLMDPEIEFSDYFWNEKDYRECFTNSNLELIQIYYPIADKKEPYNWKDETTISPFVIFIARKKSH